MKRTAPQVEIDVAFYGPRPMSGKRGLGPDLGVTAGKVRTDVLADNLQTFVANLSEALAKLPSTISHFRLDELELKLEVTVSGGVRLIGSAEVGATGGLSLVLKRTVQT